MGEEVPRVHVLGMRAGGMAQFARDGERFGRPGQDAGGERLVQPRDLGRGVHPGAVDKLHDELLLGRESTPIEARQARVGRHHGSGRAVGRSGDRGCGQVWRQRAIRAFRISVIVTAATAR